MKFFDRSGAHWLFWAGVVYLVVGLTDIFLFNKFFSEWIHVVWILVISAPFWFPPLGRWLNLDVTWDQKMFNFFKGKKPSNVVPFPEPKSVPKMPEVHTPPAPEPDKAGKTYYQLGLTDNNRVCFTMGYTQITMNRAGVQQMINQLEFYQSQLYDESEE